MIGYVQSNKGSRSSAGALAVAFSSSVTAGNLLVIAIGCYGGTVAGASISDTLGNTWVPLRDVEFNSSNVGLWGAIANGSGANTVTVTVGAGAANDLIVAEYSGASTYIDGNGTKTGQFSSLIVPTINSLSSSGDLILSAAYDQTSASTPSYSADFAIRQYTANPDGESLSLADFITSGAGSHGGETFSLTEFSNGFTMATLGLIPVSSGGGGSPGAGYSYTFLA